MLKSMTGFGRSELKTSFGLIKAEIKTVNHKYLEITPKLPYHLSEFEDSLRKQIGDELRRGKVYCFVGCPDPATFTSRLVLNEKLAKEVYAKLRELRKVLGLKDSEQEGVLLKEVLRYPDVLVKDSAGAKTTDVWRSVEKVLSSALVSLSKSREAEGRALKKDIEGRLGEMSKSLNAIQKRIPLLHKEYRRTLEKRMKDFMKDSHIEKDRLTLEVAQYVKNSDISEEVTRFRTHIDAMRKALGENGEVGRKIDFIAQEMYRESNTMGSKSNDVAIANAVINLKSAVEKIREQAQNIE